jgi:outer membrane biosynthesis protein TonB
MPLLQETPAPQEEAVVASVPAPVKQAPAPEPEPVAAPAPVVKMATKEAATTTTTTFTTTTTTMTGGVVGVVAVAAGEANAALKARALEVLASRGVQSVAFVEVCDAMQLPAAAKRLAASGKVGAVLALAALTEEVRACGIGWCWWGVGCDLHYNLH